MGWVFWTGISIGTVFSLIASIVANLLNWRIQNWIDSSKKKMSFRRKRKEFRSYVLLKELHSGKRDRYIYFLSLSTSIIIISIVSLFLLELSLFSVTRMGRACDLNVIIHWSDALRLVPPILGLLFGLTGVLFCFNQLGLYIDRANKLDKFQEYRTELEAKFGSLQSIDELFGREHVEV